jgi:CO/xanthine dehydrogenase Mo-binding subunit
MNDIAPENCLIVKLLRSPHANAIIESIDVSKALLIDGIEGVYTYLDVPKDAKRFTCAGQTYPEASPYDRLVLDRHVRFVGDVVAIIAGKNEQVVERAKKLIKVKYQVLPALLDFNVSRRRGQQAQLVRPRRKWQGRHRQGFSHITDSN